MSHHVPRGAYPDTRKLQRPRLRRFRPGVAANEPLPADGLDREPR